MRTRAKYAERGAYMGRVRDFLKEESGQDLIEYALIGLIIALGALAGMGTVASSINAEFSKIGGELS